MSISWKPVCLMDSMVLRLLTHHCIMNPSCISSSNPYLLHHLFLALTLFTRTMSSLPRNSALPHTISHHQSAQIDHVLFPSTRLSVAKQQGKTDSPRQFERNESLGVCFSAMYHQCSKPVLTIQAAARLLAPNLQPFAVSHLRDPQAVHL